MKPRAEIIPARHPIAMAIPAVTTKSEADPTATPPAKVAFKMTSISSRPNLILQIAAAASVLAVIARIVLIITRCYWVSLAKAPLKLGQNMNRNKVPTIAMVWER